MVIELVGEKESRIRKLIWGICEVILPGVEEDFGYEIRGLELASLLLENNVGEGYNCSLFNMFASLANDDTINDSWREFRLDIEVDFANDKTSTYKVIDVAIGYVFGLLPLDYR
jgi:hypothetical protein